MIIYDPKITGSFDVNGTSISSLDQIDVTSGSVSSLNDATSSYALIAEISGSTTSLSSSLASELLKNTTDTLTGDLTVTGTLTAQEFHTEYTSASIVYQSGSTKFGDSSDDVHSFTGSVKISENVDINGTELTIGNSNTRLAENNLRFKSSGDAYIDHYTTNQSIRIRTSNASALDTEAIVITGGGNFLMGNTVVNPATGFADQSGIGLKYSTTTPKIEVSSDDTALSLNRTTTGGAGVIADLRYESNVRHSFGTATSYMLGNVGIGTTSPGTFYPGNHNLVVGDGNADSAITVYANPANTSYLLFADGTSGSSSYTAQVRYNHSTNHMEFATNNSTAAKMTLDDNGNVGIGTTSPSHKLHVNGDIRQSKIVIRDDSIERYDSTADNAAVNFNYVGYNSTSTYFRDVLIWNGKNGLVAQFDGSSSNFYVPNGNVGIGTSNPLAKMDIHMSDSNGTYGRGKDGNLNLENTNTANTEGGWMSISGYMGNTTSQYQMGMITGGKVTSAGDGNYGGYLSFWTTSGGANSEANSGAYERMRIDSSGNVMMGKNSQSGNAALTVKSMAGGNTGLMLIEGDTTNDGHGLYATTDNKFAITRFTNGSYSDNFVMDSSGRVGIGTTSPEDKLHVYGQIKADQIKTRSFSSLSGSPSSGDWFPIGTIGDTNPSIVTYYIKTYAHSSIAFTVSEGYSADNRGHVQIIDHVYSANSGYANVSGVRIRQNGVVEIKLVWSSGPSVNIKITAVGVQAPEISTSLAATTETSTVVDTIDVSGNYGMMRAAGNILAQGNIGVGTTDPSDALVTVKGGGNPVGIGDEYGFTGIKFYGATSGQLEIFNTRGNTSYGNIIFKAGSSESMRIQNGGNVGIGTTSPSADLHINDTDGAVIVYQGSKRGKMIGKTIQRHTASSPKTDLFTINSFANANSNLFAVVTVLYVSPVENKAGKASAHFFIDETYQSSPTVGSFTHEQQVGSSSLSLEWDNTNKILKFVPDGTAYWYYVVDVEYVAFDGATVTFNTSHSYSET